MSSSRRYRAGSVHYLNFDDFAPTGSEMVKGRGVVIVSPSPRRDPDLVIVVPLSTLAPETHKKNAVRIMHNELNGDNGGCWAKCDMPITISTSRLSDYRRPKYAGQNHIPVVTVTAEEMRRIRRALIRAIGGREALSQMLRELETARAKRLATRSKPVRNPSSGNAPRSRPNTQTRLNRPVQRAR